MVVEVVSFVEAAQLTLIGMGAFTPDGLESLAELTTSHWELQLGQVRLALKLDSKKDNIL